jgi:hypothetical protein
MEETKKEQLPEGGEEFD